ncbi:MAG: N-acetylmuramic acid 6-phosphate etherase [Gammaproteobacteria bacterium]|nr:N-acetylmuramic acid 6-phosphate etherase [Gammaproteobacteria bacterium]
MNQATPTESASERFADIDRWSTVSAVSAMFDSQLSAIAAVGPELAAIARAAEETAVRLLQGGRLVYAGAGTSGRIAVQDGIELTPTFGWPAARVAYALAGGEDALIGSVELAEDDRDAAARDLANIAITSNDVLVGVAASGRTPYTLSAIAQGNDAGALTIGIANNRPSPLLDTSEIGICAETGSEVIAGSTRMKAGTAQKVILNLFSTATMIRCGRVCRGRMVDMVISNQKLKARAVEIIEQLAGVGKAAAEASLAAANDSIKLGALHARGVALDEAMRLLGRCDGNLRDAMDELNGRLSAKGAAK